MHSNQHAERPRGGGRRRRRRPLHATTSAARRTTCCSAALGAGQVRRASSSASVCCTAGASTSVLLAAVVIHLPPADVQWRGRVEEAVRLRLSWSTLTDAPQLRLHLTPSPLARLALLLSLPRPVSTLARPPRLSAPCRAQLHAYYRATAATRGHCTLDSCRLALAHSCGPLHPSLRTPRSLLWPLPRAPSISATHSAITH